MANPNNFRDIRHGLIIPNDRGYLYPFPPENYTNYFASSTLPSIGISTGVLPRAPMYPTVAPNPSVRRMHSIPENGYMMNPSTSRRSSYMQGVEPSVRGFTAQGRMCVCNDVAGTDGLGTPIINLAPDAYNENQPYPRVPVSQLLNTHHEVPNSSSVAGASTCTTQSETSSGSMSICSTTTTTSSRTIRPSYSVTEERFYLLNKIYRACQTAAAEHVRTFPLARRHGRGSGVPRHHPYSRHFRAKKEEKKPATLMDSISKICTRIWRRARRDLVAPHREEASAVREMRDLYRWSEVVARCMESDGLDDRHGSDVSGTDDSCENEGVGVGFPGMKVAKAAKKICRWLGDEEARNTCDTVMSELRGLVEEDEMRSSEEREPGGSEFGSIM